MGTVLRNVLFLSLRYKFILRAEGMYLAHRGGDIVLQWTSSERRLRSRLSSQFVELRNELSFLKRSGGQEDRRREVIRSYFAILSQLIALNDQAIERVRNYVCEQGTTKLEAQLEYQSLIYQGAKSGSRGHALAHLRRMQRLMGFARFVGDDCGLTSSQLRRRKVYLARKLLDPPKIPKGRPQNLVRVTKEGQRLPSCTGQYILVGGEWFQVLELPCRRGGHYHCKRVCYDRDEVFTGQMLHDVLAEEISDVSVKHPFERLLEQAEQREMFLYLSADADVDF